MADEELMYPDAFDGPSSGTLLECLRREGVQLPPPKELNAGLLRGSLWELLYALATRRIYFHSTDHLSDQEFYGWLHSMWLMRRTCDLPLEEDWDCHVDLASSGSESDNQIWLKYYADEDLRQKWRRDFPADAVPAHEPTPFDRDRWLPRPSMPLGPPDVEEEGELLETDESMATPNELHDPLQLEAVDAEIHIEQPGLEPPAPDPEESALDPGSSREELLEEPAVGIEMEHWTTPYRELSTSGVVLPPPEEMTDEFLPAKLWELFHELACRGFYFLHTNHLDDRTLYRWLWRENLREPAILPGRSSYGGWINDLIGSGSDEDEQLWLQYYATDAERKAHEQLHPNQALPPRKHCPARRDYRLPKGPF